MLQIDRVAVGKQYDQDAVVLFFVKAADNLLNPCAVEPRAGEVHIRNAGKQRSEFLRVTFLPGGDAGKDGFISVGHETE